MMVKRILFRLPQFFMRREKEISSAAKVFSSKPPISLKALVRQNMKLPAARLARRERKFQKATSIPARKGSCASKCMSDPPPQYSPDSSRPRACASNCGGRRVSASRNIRQLPVATPAPLLRAFAIWRKGSKTTLAPLSPAICAVLSVELLSTTMISPCTARAVIVSRILARVAGSNRSSL